MRLPKLYAYEWAVMAALIAIAALVIYQWLNDINSSDIRRDPVSAPQAALRPLPPQCEASDIKGSG